jgi:PPOX class probable F420-dependent enzyme
VPLMPPPVHTPEEDRAWVAEQLAGVREVWVAESAEGLVGYVVLEPAWLHSLYVRPDLKGHGIGSFLLDLVKSLRPDGFSLWVFVSNDAAQRFYRRHGLVEVRRTDGSDNDERAPDIEMAWPGYADRADDDVVAVTTRDGGGRTMPTSPVPDGLRDLLAKPNPAVITTLGTQGQPVSVATWYLLDGDRILVNMDEGRKRLGHLRRDPRVSLTALDEENWYTHVSVQGRVVEMRDDTELADIDRLATHYTGKPYAVRDRGRVSAWIEVERWHGWGAAGRG